MNTYFFTHEQLVEFVKQVTAAHDDRRTAPDILVSCYARAIKRETAESTLRFHAISEPKKNTNDFKAINDLIDLS